MKKKKKSIIQDVNNYTSKKIAKKIAIAQEPEKDVQTSLQDLLVNSDIIEVNKTPLNEISEPKLIVKEEKQKEHEEEITQEIFAGPVEIDKSFSNNLTRSINAESPNWFIVSASATGKSHMKGNIPCQDNHYCESINEKWGIAISCDGAGSAENSHLGSKHVALEIGATYFKDVILKNGWHESDSLPTQEDWHSIAHTGCVEIYNSLEKLSDTNKIKITSLACTLIVVIYSPIGLLVTHIGDGRAGYCNEQGEWKALITPHKGEEANQTIFITSQNWLSNSNFIMSGKEIPESQVINEKPTAFTLMSDGCELHSFECSIMDKETNKWHDPNLPYPKFFNPLVKNLKSMHDNNIPIDIANNKWRKFIEAGNEGLENEPDDKTMILGVLI